MDIKEQIPRTSYPLAAYSLRPMEIRDIPQVAEIEKEAFPETWPPTPLRKELANHFAGYLVACSRREGEVSALPLPPGRDEEGLWMWVVRKIQGIWGHDRKEPVEGPQEFIAGYVGIWFVIDEAHITSIAVRTPLRGRGIGELLLIGAIELSMKRSCKSVTLEVRVSNHVAQSLYSKYGFKNTGLRKGYYNDNNEDAVIMTTELIDTLDYSERFQRLVQAHQERWGEAPRSLD